MTDDVGPSTGSGRTETQDPVDAARDDVERVIRDFDAGNVTRRDAERVRDRSTRAIHDMDAARGIGSNGPWRPAI